MAAIGSSTASYASIHPTAAKASPPRDIISVIMHQIRVADTETKAKRLREDRLQNIWAMAEEKNLARAREREANGLRC
jgi:hypothetical protein